MREFRPHLSGARSSRRRRRGHGRGRGRPRLILALLALGLGPIGARMLADPAPRLIWNASPSVPIGLYWNGGPGGVSRGDLVLAWAPDAARALAASRHYLPAGVPLVKRVAALAGDTICSVGNAVLLDGRIVAERLTRDSRNRSMPIWTGCRILEKGEVFLLLEGVRDSFDGRYFGPINDEAILGKLTPIWTE